jgi:hypothetical protein
MSQAVLSEEPNTLTNDVSDQSAVPTTETIPAESSQPADRPSQQRSLSQMDLAELIDRQEQDFRKQIERRHLLVRETLLDRSTAPGSYIDNSRLEKMTLDYVLNFRRQYLQLYPVRKELLLCPANEFGIPVCSYPFCVLMVEIGVHHDSPDATTAKGTVRVSIVREIRRGFHRIQTARSAS